MNIHIIIVELFQDFEIYLKFERNDEGQLRNQTLLAGNELR